jgi:hypothetical protein
MLSRSLVILLVLATSIKSVRSYLAEAHMQDVTHRLTTGAWFEHVVTLRKIHSLAIDPLNSRILSENGRDSVVYAETCSSLKRNKK